MGATWKLPWVAALLCVSLNARAQDVPLDRFEPTPAGDALFAVPDADVPGHLLPAAGLVASYARSPLVLRRTGNSTEEVGDVVSHQLVLHAQGSLELFRRVAIEVDAPFTLSQSGSSPTIAGATFSSPSGAAAGDIRTGAKLALLSTEHTAVGVAAQAWLPSGNDGAYAGSGEVRYGGAVLVAGEYGRWLWRTQLARRVAPDSGALTPSLGSDLAFGAGAAYRIDRVQLGAELFGSTRDELLSAASTPAEALVSLKARVGPFVFGAGAGPGLTRAAGTPRYRVVGMASFSPEAPPRARDRGRDRDGPTKPETQAHGPVVKSGPADCDGDTVPDPEDQCPDVVGDPQGKRRGCPPDGDGDGILDVDDRCPTEPGVVSADPARTAARRIETATASWTPRMLARTSPEKPRTTPRPTAARSPCASSASRS